MPPPQNPLSRPVYCNSCSVYFTIKLNPHPGWTRSQIPDNFPHYLDFLVKVFSCPVCKSPLEGLN